MKKLLTAYLSSIAETTKQGDAREESYYPALKDLFTDFPLEKDRKTKVTVLPKQTEAGNPDFRIWDGERFIVGYIEAKAPGTNLDLVETSEQLQRYLQTFPNVILTDFYEFRLYRDGINIDQVTIARSFTAQKLKTTPRLEHLQEFQELAERFFSYKLPLSFTAESLAIQLAKRTRFLRDQVIVEELKQSELQKGGIYGFYQAFQKYLLPNLTPEQFADLYSQTITYGLFAARTRSETSFNRRTAIDFIPSTVGILRDVFKYISLERISEQMEVIIDDIVSILNVADINNILDQYYRQGKGEDPIVHFYETFLNQYDPQTRERRGVYYTPEPVVKYIVRSVHELLKTRFNLPDGLADRSVTLLDPAAGTMTFPAEAVKLAVQEYTEKYGDGGKKELIRNHILRNFYAFELMMAPYAIGHLKMSFLLDSLGYKMQEDERFNLYLTNTLEMDEIEKIALPFISSLSEESRLAGKIKKDEPILAIFGNPPYSGNSANRNKWTERLLKEDLDGAQSYYKVDGKPLGEKNPKWLQDDYVKFLRFAQWKIQKTGKGIVAMITNHAYLDNPTFRGMRQSLMKTFDEIYILDLHGNSLKKEIAPDDGKDENVFDIMQGVAIVTFVKFNKASEKKIFHNNLFGTRSRKYSWLMNNDFSKAAYSRINSERPFYFLIPRDTKKITHYFNWPRITEIFPVNSIGIVTSRDNFVIDWEKNTLENRISTFCDLSQSDDLIAQAFNLKDTSSWSFSNARRELSKETEISSFVKRILYRPFDKRYILYHGAVIERMRQEVMQHMLDQHNLAFLAKRQGKRDPYTYFFVSDLICESCVFESAYANNSVFPLYLSQNFSQVDLFSSTVPKVKPNILPELYRKLVITYHSEISPETIFSYIYGVTFSNVYRNLYVQLLKVDFPRIPFTDEQVVFNTISSLGQRLVDLHLLKSPELNDPVAKYQGQGDDHVIARPNYSENDQRLYINPSHYFEGLTPEVWNYQLGGYHVLDKYLKERKGRKMDDPRHFIRVATALARTIEIQEEIDVIYPEVEKNVIHFNLSD